MTANVAELERVFRTSLYGMAMFAGLILGTAEGSWLPYLTLMVASIGYWATESPGRFALGNGLSNVAGILAIALAGFEFFGDNPEGRLLAGTHLVVYATWIVFLQQSSIRKYWSICALSVLQVAVAAVLTNAGWYGGALVIFAVVAIWTLSVFSLYHAVEQQQEPSLAVAAPSSGGAYRFGPAVSAAGHSIQFDGFARWITPRFISGIATLALLALVVSAAFYVLTPRVWIGQRFTFGDPQEDGQGIGRAPITGFTENVTLGDMGQILESLEPVMTVFAYDVRSGEDRRLNPVELAEACGFDEPLFRGGVLTGYEDGGWESDSLNEIPERLPRTGAGADLRQEIVLEPVAGDILFCFGTPVACEIGNERQRASFNPLTGVLRHHRNYAESRGAISYGLHTDVPRTTRDGIPRVELRSSMLMANRYDPARDRYLNRCLRLPEDSLTRLIELAQSIRQQESERLQREPTNAEMAARLERYLRDSGEYGFTLSLSIQDRSIDPVEDFLFNRKTGHCEYFATALALMLRAVDVPSRLMNGFKGGEANYRGQIVVQQRHAHAWVEAWDGEDQWMVLDPTPAGARAEKVQQVAGDMSFTKQLQSFFGSLWTDWVMNFTPERQRLDLYEPLKEFGQKLWAQTEDATIHGLGFGTVWRFLTNPREWFSLKGLMFLAGLTGFIYLGVQLIRRLRRWWQSSRRLDSESSTRRTIVPFYAQFLELMRSRGYMKPAAYTPAEFADDVSTRLDDVAESAELGRMPGIITDLYYRVRYGNQELSEVETSSVHAALERLAKPQK